MKNSINRCQKCNLKEFDYNGNCYYCHLEEKLKAVESERDKWDKTCEVQGYFIKDLQEKFHALEKIAREGFRAIKYDNLIIITCPDGIEGCAVAHRKPNPTAYHAIELLKKIDELMERVK